MQQSSTHYCDECCKSTVSSDEHVGLCMLGVGPCAGPGVVSLPFDVIEQYGDDAPCRNIYYVVIKIIKIMTKLKTRVFIVRECFDV